MRLLHAFAAYLHELIAVEITVEPNVRVSKAQFLKLQGAEWVGYIADDPSSPSPVHHFLRAAKVIKRYGRSLRLFRISSPLSE
jgi:hypothetical protein